MKLYAIRKMIDGEIYYLWAEYDANVEDAFNAGEIKRVDFEDWNTTLHDGNLGSYLEWYKERVKHVGGDIVAYELTEVEE